MAPSGRSPVVVAGGGHEQVVDDLGQLRRVAPDGGLEHLLHVTWQREQHRGWVLLFTSACPAPKVGAFERVGEGLSNVDRESVVREAPLQTATRELRVVLTQILALADEVASGTIERQLSKSDAELGLEYLLRSSTPR